MTSDSKIAGMILFAGSVQFIMAIVISEAIYPGYSVSANTISDLGVWSKASSAVFNPSIILLGSSVIAGLYFIRSRFKGAIMRLVFILYLLAGVGAIGVGVFPAGTRLIRGELLHLLSALLALGIGGISVIASYKFTKSPFNYISVLMGVAAVTAGVLLQITEENGYLGLGVGGMERMIMYPSLLWMISIGGYLMADS